MKFSIITINLNNKTGLTKTIESVIHQTYTDFEYIVIDGASVDGSKAIIHQYQDRIDYWVSEPDAGIYQAMNKGIKVAQGEFLLFLNSGDYLAGYDVLTRVGNRISSEYGIWSGNCIFSSGGEQGIVIDSPVSISLKYLLFKFLAHPATFIRKTIFEEIGLYNEQNQVISDWEFFLTAYMHNPKIYRKIDDTISIFDTFGGISGRKESASLIIREKEDVLNRLFDPSVKELLWDLITENNYFYNRRFILLKKIETNFIFRNLIYQIMKCFAFFIRHR